MSVCALTNPHCSAKHALMFSDIDEFVATLRRHSLGNTNASAAAVDERRAMAKRARELVLARHTWPHRAEEVVTVLRRATSRPVRVGEELTA